MVSATIVPLFAAIGNIAWAKAQIYFKWSTQQTLLIQNGLYTILPIYGLLGFLRLPFGLVREWELPFVGALHGLLLGATQSSCRVLFSELLPKGHEAKFFSLYEVTDKGSTWVGPLAAALIAQVTGDIRYSFIFILGMMILPIFIFRGIDVAKGKEEARRYVEEESNSVEMDSWKGQTSMVL